MTEGLWAAIIGVGGTIVGTLLGFFLGKIDFGKLRIKIKKENESPEYDIEARTSVKRLSCVDCSFIINLYNGANKNRVFREAKIIFTDEYKNEILTLPLLDMKTARINSHLYFIDEIGVVNIPPKMGTDIKAKFSSREIEKLIKAKKAYLSYANERFKTTRKFLWKCDYSAVINVVE